MTDSYICNVLESWRIQDQPHPLNSEKINFSVAKTTATTNVLYKPKIQPHNHTMSSVFFIFRHCSTLLAVSGFTLLRASTRTLHE